MNAHAAALRERLGRSALVLGIVAEVVVFSAVAPHFFSIANLINVALGIAITGILAVGSTAVIVTAGIDLSVGSMAAVGGVVSALITARAGNDAFAVLLGIVAAIAIGVITGAGIGGLVAYAGVPPFIVTLALLTIGRGVAFIVSGGESIGDLTPSFGILGQAAPFGIPVPVILFAVAAIIGAFILGFTPFGRHVYAVGGNEEAAWLAGIDVRRTLLKVYLLNGVLVGIAGATLASRLGAGVPNAGLNYELDVIAAVVVGGTSLLGGRGTVAGTVWGTIFIGVLTNGLNLANVDPYVQKIAVGVVILLAVFIDGVAQRRSGGGHSRSPAAAGTG